MSNPRDRKEVKPWEPTHHTVKLEQQVNGEWIIRHWIKGKRRRWSVGTTATDYDYTLWMELQAALARIAVLEDRIKELEK